jgi:hypothetical protein
MHLPPLVTTSPTGTPRDDAGVLGVPGTSVLFGNQQVFDDSRSGARLRVGKWCDQCQWLGFETELFALEESNAGFSDLDIGGRILARPFFNVLDDSQDSELIQFPGVVVGLAQVESNTQFYSISPRFRVNLCCESFSTDPCNLCGPRGYRLDFLLGYRYLRLDDDLTFHERLVTAGDGAQTVFDLRDSFETSNDFQGADLGLLWEGYRGRWSLELIGRLGLGNSHEVVRINGQTTTVSGATSFNDPGGLLALSSNIGRYSRNKFAFVPELSAALGYALSPRLRCTVGYTFLYWNKVVRAGDQIDLNVNPNLLPPVVDPPGQLSPAFAFHQTDFWAQGLNLGLDFSW